MQFFKHMTSMRHDPKVKRLMRKYQANGYAVYVLILESIAEGISTESPLPVLEENVQDLSYDLGIPESQIEEIVKYCSDNGLLQIISETGIVYCVKIYKYLNSSQTRSDRLRQLIQSASGKNTDNLLFNDIKNEIETAILLQHSDLSKNTLLSQTVSDKSDRKDKEKEVDIDKEEIIVVKQVSPQFESYTPPEKKSRKLPKPSIEDIAEYCNERKNGIDAEQFYHFYEARGWKLSNGKIMTNWKSAVITWEKNNRFNSPSPSEFNTRNMKGVPGWDANYEELNGKPKITGYIDEDGEYHDAE